MEVNDLKIGVNRSRAMIEEYLDVVNGGKFEMIGMK